MIPDTVVLINRLVERISSLELTLGEYSINNVRIRGALAELQKDLQLILNNGDKNLKEMHRYLIAFGNNSHLDASEAQVWFEAHHSELLKMLDMLVILDTKLTESLNLTIGSFGSRIPGCVLELTQLHNVTRNVIQLVLKSFLVVNRFICLSTQEEEMILHVESRLNRLHGILRCHESAVSI
ncbi:Ldb18 [Kluyveromyces lactis]|nr:Ldb18 [Kluyveromyces lactis]